MATKREVAELIAILAASFPAFKEKLGRFAKQEKQRMVHAYHIALSDIDADLLGCVVEHIISTATFFPSAGEIRRAAFHLAEIGLGIPSAQDAWAEVSAMTRKGFYKQAAGGWYEVRPPTPDDWSHPLVQKAVDAVGGWVALRTSENTVADRARFIQAYDVYVERYRETERMLPGVREVVGELGSGERAPQHAKRIVSGLAEKMRF
jgi:hypothetical protein